jgi:hypothetical protein
MNIWTEKHERIPNRFCSINKNEAEAVSDLDTAM